ncbi:hypothetical protein PAQ31011_00058 [Pandoraea aquatica]|uniref:Uncharacterized protein n=1 Tax=Pandoraea aquatica TaxID=2508290 RepID=A0A5E4RBR9_9BURK|nr:hypothetical protein [Pandoraea aquatica]VVD60243.1 hypothetical protein PAQ31011_00058 [Pandoraea aquatica]
MTTESDRKTKNQTSSTVLWTESLIYQVTAKPMPKTSFMWGEMFVFGPTYGADRGILIEARTPKLVLKPTSTSVSLDKACALTYAPPGDSLADGDLTFDPPSGVARTLTAEGLEWTVSANADISAFPFEIGFDCAPWKVGPTAYGIAHSTAFELRALPMPNTCMRDDVFVFGPTYDLDGSVRGIIIEARDSLNGMPIPRIPCGIGEVYPDTAVVEGALQLPLGVTVLTDAEGRAEIPIRYVTNKPLYPLSEFTIIGNETATRYPMECRRKNHALGPANDDDNAKSLDRKHRRAIRPHATAMDLGNSWRG